MAERSDQRTRSADSQHTNDLLDDVGVDVDVDVDPDTGTGTSSRTDQPTDSGSSSFTTRLRSRLGAPFSGLFSLRSFLLVLALTVVGMLVAGGMIPLPGAGLLGVFLVGFLVGLGHGDRRYFELLLAGGVSAGVGSLFQYLALTVAGIGAPVIAVGATAGAGAAVIGHYFGRDLRDGLTRDI